MQHAIVTEQISQQTVLFEWTAMWHVMARFVRVCISTLQFNAHQCTVYTNKGSTHYSSWQVNLERFIKTLVQNTMCKSPMIPRDRCPTWFKVGIPRHAQKTTSSAHNTFTISAISFMWKSPMIPRGRCPTWFKLGIPRHAQKRHHLHITHSQFSPFHSLHTY